MLRVEEDRELDPGEFEELFRADTEVLAYWYVYMFVMYLCVRVYL